MADLTRPTQEQIRAEAIAKVARALACIQRAQNELDGACEALSPLFGGRQMHKQVAALRERVHLLWYKVEGFRGGGRYTLDDSNIQALGKRIAELTTRPGDA